MKKLLVFVALVSPLVHLFGQIERVSAENAVVSSEVQGIGVSRSASGYTIDELEVYIGQLELALDAAWRTRMGELNQQPGVTAKAAYAAFYRENYDYYVQLEVWRAELAELRLSVLPETRRPESPELSTFRTERERLALEAVSLSERSAVEAETMVAEALLVLEAEAAEAEGENLEEEPKP